MEMKPRTEPNKAVLLYSILTFLISWGGLLILGLPFGMPATQDAFSKNWPIVFIPYLMGPITSSLILTGILYGKKGYLEIFSYFKNNRFPLWGYIICILGIPLIITIVLLTLSIYSKEYLPALFMNTNKLDLIIMGLLIGLFGGGLLEELGWTGFVTPKLINREGYFKTGLLIGLIWGIWHILPTFWGSGNVDGKFSIMLFLPPLIFYIGVLPAYRLLIVWLFNKYKNIIISIVMHMSLTASTLFILAPQATDNKLVGYYIILAIILWVINITIYFSEQKRNLTTAST